MEKLLYFLKVLFAKKESKNAIWIIMGRIIQMILSFVISIYTTKYLGPQKYGIISYIAAYIAFFSSLCTLGLNAVILKEFVCNPQEQGVVLGTAITMRAISSFFSSLMIVGIVFIVDHGDKATFYVSILCSFALLFQYFDSINFWFQSRYQSKISSFALLFAYCITSLYKVYLLISGKSVFWFAFATSIDYICIALFLLLSYKIYKGPRLSVSINKGRYLLKNSYHYILSGMMVAIYTQTDRIMLKQMLDETSVGFYSLSATINGMWVFVLSAIIDSMFPTIVQAYKDDHNVFLKRNRQLYAMVIYISVFVAVMFTFLGRFAINLLYGEEFIPATSSLRILAWLTIFSYLGVARNSWIVCNNKQFYLKYIYFSSAIINIILNFLFIPRFGISGAAFASLLTQFSSCFFIPFFIKDLRPNVKLMAEAFIFKEIT